LTLWGVARKIFAGKMPSGNDCTGHTAPSTAQHPPKLRHLQDPLAESLKQQGDGMSDGPNQPPRGVKDEEEAASPDREKGQVSLRSPHQRLPALPITIYKSYLEDTMRITEGRLRRLIRAELILDLLDPWELNGYLDMGYDEFFRRKDVTREEIMSYMAGLRERTASTGQAR